MLIGCLNPLITEATKTPSDPIRDDFGLARLCFGVSGSVLADEFPTGAGKEPESSISVELR
jgi:hypothetical protein